MTSDRAPTLTSAPGAAPAESSASAPAAVAVTALDAMAPRGVASLVARCGAASPIAAPPSVGRRIEVRSIVVRPTVVSLLAAVLTAVASIVVALAALATPAQAVARPVTVARVVSQAAAGTSVAKPPARTMPPANVIADALCGREIRDAKARTLAAALDDLNPAAPPADWAWTNEPITVWRVWMTAGECAKSSSAEQARSRARRDMRDRLDLLIERGAIAADVRARLLALRAPEYRAAEWPSSCAPCVQLRAVADRLSALATPDAAPAAATVGARLRQAREGDRLESALCGSRARAAQLAADAQARFAYFTWTRTSGDVLAVVGLLRHASVDALCR